MRFFASFLFHILGNSLGILLCSYLVKGFEFSGTLLNLIEIAFFLTIFNTIFKPIIKFIFWPLIILTLGLGLILINAFGLWLSTLLFKGLTIEGFLPLIFSTLIIWAINFFLIVLAKLIK